MLGLPNPFGVGRSELATRCSSETNVKRHADIEIGDVDALATEYPDMAAELRAFQQTRGD